MTLNKIILSLKNSFTETFFPKITELYWRHCS